MSAFRLKSANSNRTSAVQEHDISTVPKRQDLDVLADGGEPVDLLVPCEGDERAQEYHIARPYASKALHNTGYEKEEASIHGFRKFFEEYKTTHCHTKLYFL